MAVMKGSNRWLSLVGAAVIFSSAHVLSYSDSGCYEEGIGDGYCHTWNNNEDCDYDGGDCCECTCESTEYYTCGDEWHGGYACIDPEAPCVEDDDITAGMVESCGYIYGMGNGWCDLENNNEGCDYDGGDCCECTCQPAELDDDNFDSCANFSACIDPEAPCADDDDITVDMVENCGYLYGRGNGWCDLQNNNAGCDYDGGDCCECTCQPAELDDDNFDTCANFSACIDPEAPCADDDDITVDMVENCGYLYGIGNGYCDMENNNAGCGWDGGDCCACTCLLPDTEGYNDQACKNFACFDPDAPCVNDDDITEEMLENCNVLEVGNGSCDNWLNNEECNYDGGDCCECTCLPQQSGSGFDDWSSFGCGGGFACIDPSAPCVDDDSITVGVLENSVCDAVRMSNALCDQYNNIAECAYDGGDCCSCTCEDTATRTCGRYGFACIDPDAACVDDDDITADMFENCDWVGSISNGYCDEDNNTPECNYDGGDCCQCTCVIPEGADDDWAQEYLCSEFVCIDPEAPCVDDDDITVDMVETCPDVRYLGDGYCNQGNNKAECNYDGGDCCECTCIIPEGADDDWEQEYLCSEFACIDPAAPCVDDDDVTAVTFQTCGSVDAIGDGRCNDYNNKAECDFDGGDCCSCTCSAPADDDYACRQDTYFHCRDTSASCYGEFSLGFDLSSSSEFVPWEQVGALPTVGGAVEVGTKTTVAISSTAYDTRPGAHVGQWGCGDVGGEGCAPANSHDGIYSVVESRWSCAKKLMNDLGQCSIEYTFGEPQDIVDIQVAFWKGDERIRTLEVHFDGVLVHTHESYSGVVFNTLGVTGTGVTTVALESVGLEHWEWISLLEVLIFVTP